MLVNTKYYCCWYITVTIDATASVTEYYDIVVISSVVSYKLRLAP